MLSLTYPTILLCVCVSCFSLKYCIIISVCSSIVNINTKRNKNQETNLWRVLWNFIYVKRKIKHQTSLSYCLHKKTKYPCKDTLKWKRIIQNLVGSIQADWVWGFHVFIIHIQIFPTDNVGLAFNAVLLWLLQDSWGIFEGMWQELLCMQ